MNAFSLGRVDARMTIALLAGVTIQAVAMRYALSDPIPDSYIETENQVCTSGCINAGKNPDQCRSGCSCIMGQIQKNLTLHEFAEASISLRDGTPPIPPEIKSKLDAALKACTKIEPGS
jgi:hypothetical protein